MSRRESRDSHSKRLHSRSERDSSPKKSRRDGKQATDRIYSSNHHLDVDTVDRDQKQRRRMQDALPLEIPPEMESKVQPETIKEGVDKKHDKRGSSEHGGRSSARRGTDHSRWSDPKEQSSDRCRDKMELQQPRADDSNSWRHDGFFELEKDAPPARKRPAFREKKIEAPPETAAAANRSEATRFPTARREEKVHYSREFENKPDQPLHRADERSFRRGDGSFQRGDTQRGGYQARERFGGGGMWGRDRFDGQYGERSTHRPGGFQAEKWKHDLFDDANRSPPPKNEEEQIAKVEALLAQ